MIHNAEQIPTIASAPPPCRLGGLYRAYADKLEAFANAPSDDTALAATAAFEAWAREFLDGDDAGLALCRQTLEANMAAILGHGVPWPKATAA